MHFDQVTVNGVNSNEYQADRGPEEERRKMFASVLSAAILGMEVHPIQVEADVSDGLPSFTMVGFPSAQVKEAQDRVRTALKNNGIALPPKRITVNFLRQISKRKEQALIFRLRRRFLLPQGY